MRPFQLYGDVNSLRRFPGWGPLTWWQNNGDTNYNSLQALFKVQLQTFQFQAAYTWSHSIGDVTNGNTSGLGEQSYTWGPNSALDRGNTELNRPQIFVANAVYYLPELKQTNAFLRNTVGGWELTGITRYSSGASTTFFMGALQDLAGGNLSSLAATANARPLVDGIPCGGLGGPAVLNPNAVTLVSYQIGTLPAGMEPRGYCRGPGYVETDFSIDKNWRLGSERLRLAVAARFL